MVLKPRPAEAILVARCSSFRDVVKFPFLDYENITSKKGKKEHKKQISPLVTTDQGHPGPPSINTADRAVLVMDESVFPC